MSAHPVLNGEHEVTVNEKDLLALSDRLSKEMGTLTPIGASARSLQMGIPAAMARHDWLGAAWQCTQIALGYRRAQRGSSRAQARSLCERLLVGEEVPIESLHKVTMPAGHRETIAKLKRDT